MTGYQIIMVRLGELFLKGRNRQRFIDQLFESVRRKLSGFEQLVVEKRRDHFVVTLNGTDPQDALKQLDYVFGIHSCLLGKVCDNSMESICEAALSVAVEACQNGQRIKFETKRGWKQFPLDSIQVSQQVAQYVGGHAPEGSVHFNVAAPDEVVRIFIKKEHALVVSHNTPAAGGLPIGLNGRALLMLSGGLDSPVAGYQMMKRGLVLEGIHFESPPYTTARARQKVYDLTEKMAHYLPRGLFRLHVVPFTELQKKVFEHIPESYGMTVMRRMMYRVSAGVAERRHIRMLTNGESLGQVASQTPDSMYAINAVTTMPVVRPLACMDKLEIMKIARQIGTYDISIRPFEDCCTVFVPKHPSTAPKLDKCERFEERFDWQSLVEDCIERTEQVEIQAGQPIALDGDTTDEICSLL